MVLAKKLPPSHRVILVERNTHFNHLYVFPRFTVYPGHEHKAFVPYSSIFSESPARKAPKAGGLSERLHAAKHEAASSEAPMDATGIEGAILDERKEMRDSHVESHDREASKVTQVSDMINERLHLDDAQGCSEPLPETNGEANGEVNGKANGKANGEANGEANSTDDRFANAEPHLIVCGQVLSMTDSHVTVRQHSVKEGEVKKAKLWSIDTVDIPYSHLIYALGSHMPDPLRHESYSKEKGVEWMQTAHKRIEDSNEIILVGGGALGVELATDIKTLYKEKKVTLIHSRKQLLPNFDMRIHEVAYAMLQKLGVDVVLGHRLALAEGCPMGSNVKHFDQKKAQPDSAPANGKPQPTIIEPEVPDGEQAPEMRQRIRTTLGLELECDLLLLCTGQQPNSSIMAHFSPPSVNPQSRLVSVLRTLQVMIPHDSDAVQQPFEAVPPCKDCDCFLDHKAAGAEHNHAHDEPEVKPGCYPHIYAIGDVADAYGALNAGYQAWFMGETAAENILRDITRRADSADPATAVPEGESVPMQEFQPGPDMIKLTIGGGKVVTQGAPEPDASLPGKPKRPTITESDDTEDMYIEGVWKSMALADPSDMYL